MVVRANKGPTDKILQIQYVASYWLSGKNYIELFVEVSILNVD